jgi:hypothetical protein
MDATQPPPTANTTAEPKPSFNQFRLFIGGNIACLARRVVGITP